jgi:dTDP-4-dehydrorhamnose reductase
VRILLTGRGGQIGSALERALAPLGELRACGRGEFDLSDLHSIASKVRGEKPDVIVNAAAYTAVDRAEREPELALHVNFHAVSELAQAACSLGALLVHFSTDYVFDGEKASPYVESDAPNPINVYGRSKLEGERAVQASGCRHLILRTGWVYAARGNNFVRTVLRLARERNELRVVGDQTGSPTAAHEIAVATMALLKQPPADGIYHVSAAGETSWYEFACAILSFAGSGAEVQRITTQEYPTAARRPRYSVLSNEKIRDAAGIALPHWRVSLEEVCRALR